MHQLGQIHIPSPKDVYEWTQTWWVTSTLVFVFFLWLLELGHRAWTNDKGDARPLLMSLLSVLSFGWMTSAMWVKGEWTDFAVVWPIINGPVVRVCLVRYLYGSFRNTTNAAARTLHIWMIVFLIRVSVYTIGETTMQRRQEAAYAGMPVDDFYFVPLLHMLWLFELCDVWSYLYTTFTIPAIQSETLRALRFRHPPRLAWYDWSHWLLSWSWLTIRVIGFTALTVVSSWVVSGTMARFYFAILAASQFALWWDLRNIAPRQLQRQWARYTQYYAQNIMRHTKMD